MDRRRFLLTSVAGAVARPARASAQQAPLPVIGFLNGASAELSANYVRPFLQGLSEMGYVEGRNVAIEFRWANGEYHRLPELAADLVRRRVAVIAATSTPAGLPAKAATSTIPIVFVTGSDPVEQGLVANLHRPGGNLTGTTTLAVDLGQKRLELMHQVVPKAQLTGVLINPSGPNLAQVMREVQAGARTLGLQIHIVHARTEQELDKAFVDLIRMRAGALVIGTDTFFNSQSRNLGALTVRHAMPAIYQYLQFVAAGGLMSYAGSITDAYRLAGVYTGRVLNGEKPSDLAVQQSAKVELFINLKSAKALGLTIPPSLLARADQVIE